MEEKHAPYVLEVKGHPATLHAAIAAVGREVFPPPATTVDRGPGRLETRSVRTTTIRNAYVDWPYVGQAFRIDRQVTHVDGSNPRDEVAVGITDRSPEQADAAQIGALVRGHWGMETRLHRERERRYDADRSQTRTQNGPQVIATVRNVAIGLLHRLSVSNLQRAVNDLNRHPEQIARTLRG